MVKIENNVITATRGDTVETTIKILTRDGDRYIPANDDQIRFAIKSSYRDEIDDTISTAIANSLTNYRTSDEIDSAISAAINNSPHLKKEIVGCTMADMGKVGRKYGLDTKYYQTDAEDVATFDRPSIIWWKYNHYCICCGLDEDGKVVIINPDRGMYRMSMGTFASFFTDYVMTNGEPAEKPSND